jgi:hypothetical protein
MILIKSDVNEAVLDWHKWFAWKPATFIQDGKHVFVWLRTIERKLVSNMTGTYFQYRH